MGKVSRLHRFPQVYFQPLALVPSTVHTSPCQQTKEPRYLETQKEVTTLLRCYLVIEDTSNNKYIPEI